MCKLVVGVCFLGWDLWLWALDVCVGDWSWRGVDWPVELLLAGGDVTSGDRADPLKFTAMDQACAERALRHVVFSESDCFLFFVEYQLLCFKLTDTTKTQL